MDAAFNYAVNGPFGWIIRPVRDFVRAGAGADVQVPPMHGLPIATPSPPLSPRPKRNSTPSPASSARPTPSPPPHIPADKKLQRKRKRNDDKISDFISMLIEAVDRDEARQQMETHRATKEAEFDLRRKQMDQDVRLLEFLRPIAPNVAALERVVESTSARITRDQDQMQRWEKERELLDTRLFQSKDQLSQLMQRIYDDLDEVLYSLDEKLLPPFVDTNGNKLTGISFDAYLAFELRHAKDSLLTLQRAREKVERSCKKWSKVLNSISATDSPEQRKRKEQQKNKLRRTWLHDKSEYDTMQRHQQEQERELLSESAKSFLINNELIFVPSKLDVISNAGRDQDLDDGDVDADKGNKFSPIVATEKELPRVIEDWLHYRQQLAIAQKELEEYHKKYDEALADHLYAFPMLEISTFYSQNGEEASEKRYEDLQRNVAAAKKGYESAQRNARKEFDEDSLPMSPVYFDTTDDPPPSQASASVASQWKDPQRKETRVNFINRYIRRMIRAKMDGGLSEVCEIKDGKPQTTPYLETGEEDPYQIPALNDGRVLAPRDRDAEVLDSLETDLSLNTIDRFRKKMPLLEGTFKK